jgi:hypothetical protein
MWGALFNWVTVSIVVTVLIGIGVGVLSMAPPHYIIAQFCFSLAGLLLLSRTAWWIAFEQSANTNAWQRGLFVVIVFGAIGFIWLRSIEWVQELPKDSGAKPSQQEDHKAATPFTPSLVFIFGAPLGENDSPVWIMMLKHYGPDTAYSCDIVFVDDDRKNIEHQWLVEHPDSSFLPIGGVAGKSQVSFHISEAGPEGAIANFQWTPIDRNNQHYTVSISCREGVFVEHWHVTRADGVLRTKITIERGPQWVEKNPMRSPVVFACTEPGFISTPLASVLPEKTPPLVNPGWKPNHRFYFPVAILDPNGNIEVMSGVKLPDGSQKTDFGCWNMLTRHFGDKP